MLDNIPRVLPAKLSAVIHSGSWTKPKVFDLVQDSGNITHFEMIRTFNMGIGMVLILDPKHARQAQKRLQRMKLASWVIGEIVPKSPTSSRVMIG